MKKKIASSIDLILLGLIRNTPMSPYEVSKHQGIFELVKISIPAIYKNLRRLASSGYLEYEPVTKGKMPPKKIYSITKNGEEYFDNLLNSCLFSPIQFYFDFNVPLLFINSIEKSRGKKMIRDFREQLTIKHEYLARQKKEHLELPFPIGLMAQQQMDLCSTLLDWTEKLQTKFDEHSSIS